MERLGTGIGWRPEIADAVERMPGIDWVEAVAENVCPGHLPDSLWRLRERGVTVVPHGVSLGLGGADRPDEARLTALAERATALGSPLVTEHIAFVRAGGPLTASPRLEAGHLLPVPRTRDALDVLCENVRIAQAALPVPLAVENIAALISWPGEEMTEGQFLYELADRTGVRLLIDVANLHTNHVNRGENPAEALADLPLEAIAYVHVAGGFERDGVWHDSHAHPVPRPVLDILTDLASRVSPPGVLLERDENFPEPSELERELGAIREALEKGREQGGAAVRGAAGKGRARTEVEHAPDSGPATPERTLPAARTRGTETEQRERTPQAPTTPPAVEAPETGEPELASAPSAPEAPGTTGVRGQAPGASHGAGSASTAGVVPDTAPARRRLREAEHGPEAEVAGEVRRASDDRGQQTAPDTSSDTAPARQRLPEAERGPEAEASDTVRPASGNRCREAAPDTAPARQRLALAQTALLSALVAGTPVPEGFDRVRIGVQARALAGKRADVVAKVAPELPEILGAGYRAAFLGYTHGHPMTDGYRRDALNFAGYLLGSALPEDPQARGELREWWLERSGSRPRSHRPAARLARATRRVLLRR